MSLDGFDEWRSTVKVHYHYLCCGREVPSDVAPEHNIAVCSFCFAKNEWRAAREKEKRAWIDRCVCIGAGFALLALMWSLSRVLVP